MGSLKALYFVALLPPSAIREEILKMKLNIKEKFGVAHALKLPAHITLIPPVWLKKEQEMTFFNAIHETTQRHGEFEVELKGFGHFGKKVIFIEVVNHEPVKELHQKLLHFLKDFLPEDEKRNLHPHVTLATRDLKEKFSEVWTEISNHHCHSVFTADSVTLFRHNGKSWDVMGEFPLRGQEVS